MYPVRVRALMEAMSELKLLIFFCLKKKSYKHLKVLRLWKVQAEDEGVRKICNYMKKV